jgi:hypothetical protein
MSRVRPWGSPFFWVSAKPTVRSAWAPAWLLDSEEETDSTA